MKIAIPVMSDVASFENVICDHFGTAPYFAIIDTSSSVVKIIKNDTDNHQHGACNPLAAIAGENLSAIVVRGIGAGAIGKLQAAKIEVFQATDNHVKTAVAALGAKTLPKLTSEGACSGHSGCGDHHSH
jgi:predicted Fe-Mo cluster-binding NifX family protein